MEEKNVVLDELIKIYLARQRFIEEPGGHLTEAYAFSDTQRNEAIECICEMAEIELCPIMVASIEQMLYSETLVQQEMLQPKPDGSSSLVRYTSVVSAVQNPWRERLCSVVHNYRLAKAREVISLTKKG